MKDREPSSSPQVTPAGRLVEGPLDAILGYQLAQATVVTDQVFASAVREHCDLRKVEFSVLALVAGNEGLTAAQLAAALAFTAPNTAAWIDRLSRRGLVEREQHQRDKRAMHIRLTPEGDALLKQAIERVREREAQAFSRLTRAERLMLLELLHKAAGCRQRD